MKGIDMGGRLHFSVFAAALLMAAAGLSGCPTPTPTDATNPAGVSLSRAVVAEYEPGEIITVTLTIRATDGDSISAIGLTEHIPAGWSFVSATGPALVPPAGAEDMLEFAWLTPPAFPYTFAYAVMAPRDGRGAVEIAGSVEYREDAGPYTTREVVSALSSINPAGVSLARSHPSAYEPATEITISIEIDAEAPAMITALGFSETLPAGWTFVSAAGSGGEGPEVGPEPGAAGVLEFAWISIPVFPYTFTYTVAIPEDAAGAATLTGYVAYRLDGGPLSTDDLSTSINGAAR